MKPDSRRNRSERKSEQCTRIHPEFSRPTLQKTNVGLERSAIFCTGTSIKRRITVWRARSAHVAGDRLPVPEAGASRRPASDAHQGNLL
jgi:hypothetical protein